MAKHVLVINGPNLNLLGYREPSIYGSTTLTDVQTDLQDFCTANSATVTFYQSNSESLIVDCIQASRYPSLIPETSPFNASSPNTLLSIFTSKPAVDAIVINAGAYTHTSVAIRDALGATGIPFVECHVSNVHAREEFRHKSFLSDKAVAVVAGLGTYGYRASVEFCVKHLKL